MTFDEYCEEHDITPAEVPAALGAYLNAISGWDGDQHDVPTE